MGPDALASAVLALVQRTYLDLHRQQPHEPITLKSRLDRDLGFDSLSRVELLQRMERTFSVRMPDSVLESAETPGDLLHALHNAGKAVPADTLAAIRVESTEPTESAPSTVATLVEALDWHVRRHPDRVQIRYVEEVGEDAKEISYSQLQQQASAVAAGIQACGQSSRQPVAIMLPTGPDYFHAYLGVLMAGCVPVPIYPPFRRSQIEEHVRRQAGILTNAQAAMLITVPEARAIGRLLEARVPELRKLVTVEELQKNGPRHIQMPLTAGDIAFIQYTSGSTGSPKGVVLTHANLLANIRSIGEAVRIVPSDVFVSWLPLYHDMGLIAAWLASLYFGNPLVVMSPMTFLARPERWLWAIHRYRGTLTAAPNFAYELCLKRIEDDQIKGLNLESLRLAANGSEQVFPDTIARFQQRFGRFGFRPESMTPVYGLAEATVGLLVPPLGRMPVIDRAQRLPLVREGRALTAATDDTTALSFVACGRPLPRHQVRIVDANEHEVGERVEGRLEFRGPSATQGYYRNPELTRSLFRGEWLDSGDRAYVAAGDVYLTGRVKDIIIRGGHHIYPHEIEAAVGDIQGIRRGCVAVFGIPEPQSGTERLVVLAETRITGAREHAALRDTVIRATVDLIGEPPDEVVLAPPKTVLKTSSGKLRRSATRDLYAAGLVGAPLRLAAWQLARLVGSSAIPQLHRWIRSVGERSYAAYAWTLFALFAPLAWLIAALTPHPSVAWPVMRTAARLFLRLCAIRVDVHGLDRLPRSGLRVVVANHASYLDGLILMAALPGHHSFVAKKEFQRQFIPRVFLQRLGTEFVERFAIQESVQDTRRIVSAMSQGRSLVFFPEGTFAAADGLLPFHLGAFVVAAKARALVVPVAIRGSRNILRGDLWFPRHGAVTVTIGKPLETVEDAGDAFAAAVRLRDAARARILEHCGEPEVGQFISG